MPWHAKCGIPLNHYPRYSMPYVAYQWRLVPQTSYRCLKSACSSRLGKPLRQIRIPSKTPLQVNWFKQRAASITPVQRIQLKSTRHRNLGAQNFNPFPLLNPEKWKILAICESKVVKNCVFRSFSAFFLRFSPIFSLTLLFFFIFPPSRLHETIPFIW